MAKYPYDIEIEALSHLQADDVMKAILTLKKKFTCDEIIKLAKKVDSDPLIKTKAKMAGLI